MNSRHLQSFPTDPGLTQVTTIGMCIDNFDTNAATKVDVLLTKHQLQQKLALIHDDLGLYYLVDRAALSAWEQPGSVTFTVEDIEDLRPQHMLMLNLDDETDFTTIDAIVPPAFVENLIELLHTIAALGPVGSLATGMTITDYVMSVGRKSLVINHGTNPSWADYQALLRL